MVLIVRVFWGVWICRFKVLAFELLQALAFMLGGPPAGAGRKFGRRDRARFLGRWRRRHIVVECLGFACRAAPRAAGQKFNDLDAWRQGKR